MSGQYSSRPDNRYVHMDANRNNHGSATPSQQTLRNRFRIWTSPHSSRQSFNPQTPYSAEHSQITDDESEHRFRTQQTPDHVFRNTHDFAQIGRHEQPQHTQTSEYGDFSFRKPLMIQPLNQANLNSGNLERGYQSFGHNRPILSSTRHRNLMIDDSSIPFTRNSYLQQLGLAMRGAMNLSRHKTAANRVNLTRRTSTINGREEGDLGADVLRLAERLNQGLEDTYTQFEELQIRSESISRAVLDADHYSLCRDRLLDGRVYAVETSLENLHEKLNRLSLSLGNNVKAIQECLLALETRLQTLSTARDAGHGQQSYAELGCTGTPAITHVAGGLTSSGNQDPSIVSPNPVDPQESVFFVKKIHFTNEICSSIAAQSAILTETHPTKAFHRHPAFDISSIPHSPEAQFIQLGQHYINIPDETNGQNAFRLIIKAASIPRGWVQRHGLAEGIFDKLFTTSSETSSTQEICNHLNHLNPVLSPARISPFIKSCLSTLDKHAQRNSAHFLAIAATLEEGCFAEPSHVSRLSDLVCNTSSGVKTIKGKKATVENEEDVDVESKINVISEDEPRF